MENFVAASAAAFVVVAVIWQRRLISFTFTPQCAQLSSSQFCSGDALALVLALALVASFSINLLNFWNFWQPPLSWANANWWNRSISRVIVVAYECHQLYIRPKRAEDSRFRGSPRQAEGLGALISWLSSLATRLCTAIMPQSTKVGQCHRPQQQQQELQQFRQQQPRPALRS